MNFIKVLLSAVDKLSLVYNTWTFCWVKVDLHDDELIRFCYFFLQGLYSILSVRVSHCHDFLLSVEILRIVSYKFFISKSLPWIELLKRDLLFSCDDVLCEPHPLFGIKFLFFLRPILLIVILTATRFCFFIMDEIVVKDSYNFKRILMLESILQNFNTQIDFLSSVG